MDIRSIAKICHEANKAYCETIGDTSQVNWEDAPEWQKESAIKGVAYHVGNQDSKASDCHEYWLKEKKDSGWIWGPEKNESKKEHPCIVPFDQLPFYQQKKDILFLSIVRALSL